LSSTQQALRFPNKKNSKIKRCLSLCRELLTYASVIQTCTRENAPSKHNRATWLLQTRNTKPNGQSAPTYPVRLSRLVEHYKCTKNTNMLQFKLQTGQCSMQTSCSAVSENATHEHVFSCPFFCEGDKNYRKRPKNFKVLLVQVSNDKTAIVERTPPASGREPSSLQGEPNPLRAQARIARESSIPHTYRPARLAGAPSKAGTIATPRTAACASETEDRRPEFVRLVETRRGRKM
jgi:hypothetical protein